MAWAWDSERAILQQLPPRAIRACVPVTLTGWILVLGLMLYATALDLGRYLA